MRLSVAPSIVVCALTVASPALAQRALNLADLEARVTALEARLAELTPASPDLAASLARLESELAALRQDLDALGKSYHGNQDLVGRVDAIDQELAELGERTASLRADLESRTSPEAAARGGGAGLWADGFRVVDEPRFALRVNGLVQLRYTWLMAEAPGDDETLPETLESGFSLRRLRLAFSGRVHSPKLRYVVQAELAADVRLLDGYLEGDLPRGFFLRAGQQKVPFSRSWLRDPAQLVFVERSLATDELRHDRDLGLLAGWRGWDARAEVVAGVMNGGGTAANANDNRDPLLVLRGEVAPLAALTLGAGLSFENLPVPGLVGYGGAPLVDGVDLDADVDGDGQRDNVQVLQLGVDLALRWRGLAVDAEVVWRDEDWGVIDDAQSPAVPFEASRSYLGGFAQATYAITPRLVAGARFARTEVSPILLGRVRGVAPVDERRWEASAVVSHAFAYGLELTAMYSFLDWTDRTVGVATSDVGTAGAGEQRLLVEAQVAF
jgi:hypothetical protein